MGVYERASVINSEGRINNNLISHFDFEYLVTFILDTLFWMKFEIHDQMSKQT